MAKKRSIKVISQIGHNYKVRARVEFEIKYNKSINREMRILDVDDNIYELSKNMEQYKGYRISEIDPITSSVTFTNGEVIRKGDVVGDVSEKDMRRIQIRETIISHMEKEEELFNRGIKTLSLFFIDEVAKYRMYDDDGEELLGEYGRMFEEEYRDVVNNYITIFDTPYQRYLKAIEVETTHKGYFSIDKKGHVVNSDIKRGSDLSDTSFDKAYRAEKHIQDYVFTDGTAEKSVERKFAEELDGAKEVCVYAKLPKGFSIPTPVGNYSPDWAIAFYEGTVKHIYFIAETKGTMESLELRPIEKAKISCARKLFNEISTENVVYHDVDSYQSLLSIMNSI